MQHYGFYEKYFTLKSNTREVNVICPFHSDKDPSMSIDLESGKWYCHSCKFGGDIFEFYMKYHSCSFAKAKNDIMGNAQFPVLSFSEVNEAHDKLLNSDHLQKLLLLKRGWTHDTIVKYKLGWGEERVFIPVYGEDEILKNIRKYDVLHKTKQKFKGVKGYNQIRLYPIEALQEETIIICAGEPDTLLARQHGFNAVTFTGGEGAFKHELLPLFEEKIVYIVYDVDEAGQRAASSLADNIKQYATETYIVNLPKELLPATGDFTDLVFVCLEQEKELIDIWNPCIELALKVEKDPVTDTEYKDVDFYEAVSSNYYNADIHFKAMAIGKNLSPYYAPKNIKVSCDFGKGDQCKNCIMFAAGGQRDVEVKGTDALELIKCSSNEQKIKIKNIVGISGCNQFKVDTLTVQVLCMQS